MSASLLVFLSECSKCPPAAVTQNRSLFRINRIALSVTPVANHSILKQGSLQLGNVGWIWRIYRPSIAPHMIIQRIEIWRLKY